jgi:hypothetical protein
MNIPLAEAIGVGFSVGVFVFFVYPLWGAGGTGAFRPRSTITKLATAILAGFFFGAFWYFRGHHYFFSN